MYLLITALFIAAVVGALYVMWRIRWGYPPGSFPRVLAYHKVTSFEFGGTWVPPARFVAQLDALLEAGFSFIDESAFLETVDGTRGGSPREILLTFDDGYRKLLEHAIPALDQRRIPALIFLVSGYVGRENEWELNWPGRRFHHIDWDEARDLAGRGFTFGSHTCTHRDLTRLGREDVRCELIDSKLVIEERLGKPVHSLSYPFGLTNPSVSQEAAKAGYRAAFSMYPSIPNGRIERYNLRREGVYIVDALVNLRGKLGRGGMFWCEDLKGRAINAASVLTPILKGNGVSRTER
jgi:peptidoglycan/xylan/chitin deacetylase (PgdA/CDA1 family)